MKRFLSLFLTLLCLLSVPGCVKTAEQPTAPPTATPMQNIRCAFCSVAALSCKAAREATTTAEMCGSAVVFRITDKGAYLLTNYHVIYEEATQAFAESITVSFFGGVREDTVAPIVVGGSAAYDLAVLFLPIAAAIFPPIRAVTPVFSDITAGEKVFLLGNPLGAGLAVTEGIVSVAYEKNGAAQNGWASWKTRLSAPLNRGDSGGGAFTEDGRWLGIMQARNAREGVTSLGYCIPSPWAAAIAEQFIRAYEAGTSPRIFNFGVSFSGTAPTVFLSPDCALRTEYRVTAEGFAAGSVGAAFLEAGDIVTACRKNGDEAIRITSPYCLELFLLTLSPGDTLTVDYERGGKAYSYSVSVEETHTVPLL